MRCRGPTPPNATGWVEICDNLTARIAEAQRDGWLGEIEGLKVSLAGANDKLAQLDWQTASHNRTTVDLGMPTVIPPDRSWRAARATNLRGDRP